MAVTCGPNLKCSIGGWIDKFAPTREIKPGIPKTFAIGTFQGRTLIRYAELVALVFQFLRLTNLVTNLKWRSETSLYSFWSLRCSVQSSDTLVEVHFIARQALVAHP